MQNDNQYFRHSFDTKWMDSDFGGEIDKSKHSKYLKCLNKQTFSVKISVHFG